MKVYTTDKIRNVVLLGHGGSGKTSLAEAMGYLSGITSRMGKVADGNTLSDYSKEEQKRQFSISTSVIPIEWEGCKINILRQRTDRHDLHPTLLLLEMRQYSPARIQIQRLIIAPRGKHPIAVVPRQKISFI